jgi:hypothetical protein
MDMPDDFYEWRKTAVAGVVYAIAAGGHDAKAGFERILAVAGR